MNHQLNIFSSLFIKTKIVSHIVFVFFTQNRSSRETFFIQDYKRENMVGLVFFILYRDEAVGDDLSELQSEAVPEEVRKWLASTFAKQETAPRRRGPDERPTFRSVANAIRTGIFIEKIYRRMSSSQLMAIPPDIHKALKVHQVFPSHKVQVF